MTIDRRTALRAALAAPLLIRSRAALAGPTRVAALDYAVAEPLLALEFPPVAMVDTGEWNQWAGDPPLPPETVDIGTALAPNVELLAALQLDLVLSTDFTAPVEAEIRRFARVERFSIFSPGGSPLPKATEALRRIGGLVGLEARATAYLAETERVFSDLAERARPFRDVPILMLSFLDPRHARVYARPGLQQDVFDRLGLRNAWGKEGTEWGFATVGIEQLATVGEARAVADYMPDDVAAVIERSPLWRELPIRRGRGPIPVLPPVLAFGGVPAARRLAGLLIETLESGAA
jgi:ferric hydroxamate transport system substrate-binding protein